MIRLGFGSVLHQLPARVTPGITDRYLVVGRYFGLTGELLEVALITRTGEIDQEDAYTKHCIGVETPKSCELWVIQQEATP